MRIKNPSAMQVSYAWSFYNHNPSEDIKVSEEALSKSKGLTIPLNEIFDLLPIRATLDPGEQQIVEASFYAFPGYSVHAVAVCRVCKKKAKKQNIFYSFLYSSILLLQLHI